MFSFKKIMSTNKSNSGNGTGNAPYISPTPGEIPIMVSQLFPRYDGLILTAYDFETAKDCGINAFFCSPQFNKLISLKDSEKQNTVMMNVFDLADQYGLKVIFCQDASETYRFNNQVKAVHSLPALGCYLMRDEPRWYNWHEGDWNNPANLLKDCNLNPNDENVDKSLFYNILPTYKEIRKNYPEHMVSLNLAATESSCFIGPTTGRDAEEKYDTYLDQINEAFAPPVWMFDYYPVRQPIDGDGSWSDHREAYYRYLNSFLKMSRKTGRPLWVYCQSVEFILENKENKLPTPTEAMLRYEAFSALAFGAKGIAYWYYAERDDPDHYITSPIRVVKKDGVFQRVKTPIWTYMQTVNREIKKYSKVFLNSTLSAIFQSSVGIDIKGLDTIRIPYACLTSLLVSGGGVVISRFVEDTDSYLMLVNKSVEVSTRVRIRFSKSAWVETFGSGGVSGRRVISPATDDDSEEIEWTLMAGGYVIFKWEIPIVGSYISPTPGEFPIMTTTVYPQAREPETSDFTGAVECGFNAIIGHPNNLDSLIEKWKESKSGLRMILSQGGKSNEDFLKIVKDHLDETGIAAWLLLDQPYYYNLYPGASIPACDTDTLPANYKRDMMSLFEEIRKLDPERMVLFNFACSSSPCYIGNNSNYSDYLESLEDLMHPAVWCFDIYPVRGSDSNWTVEYDRFYKYMKAYADISAQSLRPFWYYCQSVSFKLNGNVHLPTPTVDMLRYEVFTAIAFGAQGIIYWYYAQRNNEPGTEYIISPVRYPGVRTSVWNVVKEVNEEIKRYEDIFLNADFVSVKSSSTPHYGLPAFSVSPAGPITKLVASLPGAIISQFRKSGRNYYMMVSKDLKNTIYLTIKFSTMHTVVALYGDGDYYKSVSGTTKTGEEVQCGLKPGGYIIIQWSIAPLSPIVPDYGV